MVIFAPHRKRAVDLGHHNDITWPLGPFVHTAHTSSALAEEWDDPPNGPFPSPVSVIWTGG